jgi:dimethylargininase
MVQHAAGAADVTAANLVFPALQQHPDCCFVDDCIVSWPGVAVLTRPALASRRGEVNLLERFLNSFWLQNEWPLHIHRFKGHERCDGGDVLRVGGTLFIGESERTSAAAHDRWRRICSDYSMQCVAVPLGECDVHLKSLVSWVGPDVGLMCAHTPFSLAACKAIVQHTPVTSRRVFVVNDPREANMLRVGRAVFHRPGAGVRQLQRHHPQLQFLEVDISELEKKQGTLTACSAVLRL